MSTESKPRGAGRPPDRADFDLVEDIGDAAAFDRALDELLPKGDLSLTTRYDIDPDDFEAFNRELDAQIAEARSRTGRIERIEDLGTDIVEPLPAPAAAAGHERTGPEELPAAPAAPDQRELPDDVVTLGATTAGAATVPPTAGPPPAPAEAPSPAGSAPGSAAAGRGAGIAVLLGLAGLVAGGTALWLSLEREAELTRLQAALDEKAGVRVVPPETIKAPAVEPAQVRALEDRLEEVSRRVGELSATAPSAAAPEPAPRAEEPPPPPGPAPPPPPTQPAKAPADEPPTAPPPPTEAKPPVSADATMTPPAAPARPAPAALPAPAAAAAEPPGKAAQAASPPPAAQALPRPAGNGSWAIVIDSFADESTAEQRSVQVQRMNLPAEVRWFLVDDQVRYRVVVPGYSTREAANTAAAELRRRKAGGAWVTQLQKRE